MDNYISALSPLSAHMIEGVLMVLLLLILAQLASYAQFVDHCQAEFVEYLRGIARTEAPKESGDGVAIMTSGDELNTVPNEERRFRRRKSLAFKS